MHATYDCQVSSGTQAHTKSAGHLSHRNVVIRVGRQAWVVHLRALNKWVIDIAKGVLRLAVYYALCVLLATAVTCLGDRVSRRATPVSAFLIWVRDFA